MNRLSGTGGLGIAGAPLTPTSATTPALARAAACAAKASAGTPKCIVSAVGAWVAADQGDGALETIFLEISSLSGHTCPLYVSRNVGHRQRRASAWQPRPLGSPRPASVITLARGDRSFRGGLQRRRSGELPECKCACRLRAADLPTRPVSGNQCLLGLGCLHDRLFGLPRGVRPIQPGAGARAS